METAEMAAELATGHDNRRAAPRQSVDEDARLLLVEHGSTVSCRIVDISLSGCRLRTKERFTAGSMVSVEVAFKVRGLAFRFSGTTQWTDGRNLVGIRFTGVSARRREDLVEALSEVEAENAAKAAQQAAEMQVAAPQVSTQKAAAVPVVEPAEEQKPLQTQVQAPAPAIATQAASPAPANPAPRERRVQAREEVNTTAVIFLINVASRLQGRILDLSLSGCRIRADERFPVGIYTRVETEFRLEGLPFRLGGVVQAIHDRHTVGIRFLDMSSRKREQVTQLIEEIRQMKEQEIGNRE
jgi:c-di-GMP-binding flagellar brake protein YcgR